jgi:hypothetical protein
MEKIVKRRDRRRKRWTQKGRQRGPFRGQEWRGGGEGGLTGVKRDNWQKGKKTRG